MLAPRKVVRRYVTGWLLPDFFSIFPIEVVLLLLDAEGREFSDSTRVIKMASDMLLFFTCLPSGGAEPRHALM